MYIYSIIYIVIFIYIDVIALKFSNNVVTFINPFYINTHISNIFSKIRIKHGIPSDGKKFTLEDLIEQNIIPQPPVFDNDPGYNQFHKINYKKLARERLNRDEERISQLDKYFNNSKNYTLDELLNILNKFGIYPYMSIRKTIEIINYFNHSINEYKTINHYIDDEIIERIHGNRAFLRIIGSIRRHLKILKNAIVRKALLDDPKIKKSLPQFRNTDIVDIFEILSLTKYKNDNLIELLINYVEENLKDFNISQLCNIIYNISKLKYNSINIVNDLKIRLNELSNISPIESLQISEALVSCDYIEKDIFDILSSLILIGIEEFELNELIRIFKTFTSAEYINNDFYSDIIKSITSKLDDQKSSNSVLDLLSSLSHMNIKDTKLLDFISCYIINNFSSFSPIQLASGLKYFAMLQYYSTDLFKKIFNLPIFTIIPDVDVMDQIRMGYHKNQCYTAYIHKYPLCELDKLYNKIFIAYKSYQLESSDLHKFKFSDINEKNLRDIFIYQSREKIFSSSSIHLEIADIYKNLFNIDFYVGYPTDEGFLVDLAYITDDGFKFAINVNGPYSFMQRCLSEIPPPFTVSSMLKDRLLKKTGWNISHINYWDYATWFSLEKKKQVLLNILPKKIMEMCK